MAGIYLHIPLCRQACYYCDFHFSTFLDLKPKLLTAIKTEIILQRSYLNKDPLETIYFGGGTPSILDIKEIEELLDTIYENFNVDSKAEYTIEANPDD
jgi:oxygen-independent coproporphyrinogen-3 oxidase